MKDEAIALATYDLILTKLARGLSGRIGKSRADPKLLDKSGVSIMRLRIFPKEREPKPFWSSDWCFYEIGIGNYAFGRSNFGAVQFVMFPDNKQCGSGHYRQGVQSILRGLRPAGRQGYFLDASGGATGAAILCGFRYCLGEFACFPKEQAAEDMAWLIGETVGPFAALS